MHELKKNLQKTFFAGAFAKLLDVNKDTLLYYDKIDLFKPAGTYDNGYRYYTLEQLDSFIAIQSLRAVQFPIKDLKEHFKSPSQDALQALAIEQLEKVKAEMKKLNDIQFFLSRVIEIINELNSVNIGELIIKELPEEPIIYSSTKKLDWNASIEELSKTCGDFIKTLGIKATAANGLILNKNNLFSKDYHQYDYLFCLIDGPNAVKKPAGLHAILYYQGTYDNIESAYSFLVKELAVRNLVMDENIYEEYLLHSLASKNEEEYITKISVKVKYL